MSEYTLPKTPVDRKRKPRPRVDVTCVKCGTEQTVSDQTRNRWLGGWLCHNCQMKRYNHQTTSGGNWIEKR